MYKIIYRGIVALSTGLLLLGICLLYLSMV